VKWPIVKSTGGKTYLEQLPPDLDQARYPACLKQHADGAIALMLPDKPPECGEGANRRLAQVRLQLSVDVVNVGSGE